MQSTGVGVSATFNSSAYPSTVPGSGNHSRKVSESGTFLSHLETVDRLEVICATEPNDVTDELGVFELADDENGDEVLIDNTTTPKARDAGRKKSFSNNFKTFSGKDPAKTRPYLVPGTTNSSGRPSLGGTSTSGIGKGSSN